MKRYRVISLLAALVATAALAATVVWEGITWNDPYGSISVSGGSLIVEAPVQWGTAHYNTPSDFRSAAAPCVEVSFVDDDADAGAQIWIEDENYPVGGAWTQFGTWGGYGVYYIYWWDYDTDTAGWINTGVARTPGEHTLKVGMRADGTVDYWLDGMYLASAPITPSYFGDVYLACNNAAVGPAAVEYTSYSTCMDYVFVSAEIEVNPKSINLRSKGKTKVTILSEGAFDATSVDPASVLFAGAAVAGNNKGKLMSSTADADGDGDVDLILHFNTQDLDLAVGDTAAELTGTAVDLSGNPYPFHATGAVNINKG